MSALSLRFVPVDERLPGSAPGRFDEPLLDDYLDFLAGRPCASGWGETPQLIRF